MQYTKTEAKEWAKERFTGVWAAVMTPFDPEDLSVDEAAYRKNLEHWIGGLELDGLFVGGKQAEAFSMSLDERRRQFELSVEAAAGRCGIITSCSDTRLDTVLELARYSQDIGADVIVVHSPVLHFGADTDETIYEYYRYLSEQLDIGIAMWNHPDCGYVMSPRLCARIAELPNIVAIKYSVPRPQYVELSRLAGDRIHVSTASEDEWFDNIVELGWRLYLCSTPPFLLQTPTDRRINEYTRLAFEGRVDEARRIRDSLEPARRAFANSRPAGKPQPHSKAWMELLGQVGGPCRRPLLPLTDDERAVIREAFAHSGLQGAPAAPAA